MKNIIGKWWFWLIICVLLIVVIWISSIFLKPEFEIADFSIKKETTEYEYIDDYIRYSGKGIITTKDKKNTYIVIMEQKLVSGGNKEDDKEETTTIVLITNGKGEFSTYDYGGENEIKKPKYEFEILGYVKVK